MVDPVKSPSVIAGLKEHSCQPHVIFDGDSDEEWRKARSRESYVIAWPPRPPDQGRLQDIFKDLDQ